MSNPDQAEDRFGSFSFLISSFFQAYWLTEPMKKSANNGRRPQTATEKKKLMVGLDGHWLTFPFPFVHHQPLHIFYLSSSFLFHVYLQRKRKINIRRNKKEEGEDRRLPTVETRTSGRLVVSLLFSTNRQSALQRYRRHKE